MPTTFKVGDLVRPLPKKYGAEYLKRVGTNTKQMGIIRSVEEVPAATTSYFEVFFFELRDTVYLYTDEIEKVKVNAGDL